jgi:hypothetical protein
VRLLATDRFGEAGVRAVDVEESDTAADVDEAVSCPRQRGVEGVDARTHHLLSEYEAGLAVEHEERVDLVVMVMGGDPRPLGVGLESKHGDFRQGAEDRYRPVPALEALTSAGRCDDRVGGRPAAVRRRGVLVEGTPPAEVVGEAGARRMEVEEPQLSRPVVVEAVHDTRRHHDQRAGGCRHALQRRPDLQGQLAREYVERIDVTEVDVRLGPALSLRMTGPGDVQPVVVAEDPQLAVRRVADRLPLVDS